MKKALTLDDVKRNNKEAGLFWFSPDSMRFFRCKIESELIGGKFFVSSEQFAEDAPRLYSIRKYDSKTHSIDTVGKFQEHETRQDALDAIREEGIAP